MPMLRNSLILIFLCICLLNAQQFSSSNLPIIVIDTDGQSVTDEPKITAMMGVIYNGPGVRNNISDPFNNYNGFIGIERRGSSSQSFPKKSYAIETRLADGSNNNVSLLGMPEENDWVLHAPYSDKSLIRNVLTFDLFNRIGRYSSRTQFCEVILNGDYVGLYVLMEKIKRDDNRVDIATLQPVDNSGDELTGGYVLKIDKTEGEEVDGWISKYRPPWAANRSIFIQYHEPKPSEITTEQKAYIKSYIDNFEDMLASDNFADPQNGYPAWIDVGSFIDFFLINELSRNVDGFRLSTYFYKDKDSVNPKITMGPLWDFNLAFGNADYYDGSDINGLFIDYDLPDRDGFHIPFWWRRLMEDPVFVSQVIIRWNYLRQTVFHGDSLNAAIDDFTEYIWEAQQRNFDRWDILDEYVWPNIFIGGSYPAEINYLKQWIAERSSWLDYYFNSVLAVENIGSIKQPTNFELISIAPNPFNPSTGITMQISISGNVSLTVYDAKGRLVEIIADKNYTPGIYNINWDAGQLTSGVYFIRMQAANFTSAKKAVLLR